MRIALQREMQNLDQATCNRGFFSSEQLMKNAGHKIVEALIQNFQLDSTHNILVMCGSGNNGGDGFIVAELLSEKGFDVAVVTVDSEPGEKIISRSELNQKFYLKCKQLKKFADIKGHDVQYDLIIDAIFGIGLNRNVGGQAHEMIQWCNHQSSAVVVAVDIPSGLQADQGLSMGGCVRADLTLTLGHPKLGLFINQGPAFCGKIRCLDIGFPSELSRQFIDSIFLVSKRTAALGLRRRKLTQNKSSFGRVLIIGGDEGMEGAAVLSGIAAARMGVGYVTIASRSHNIRQLSPPDFLWMDFAKLNTETLKKFDAIIFGPGLSIQKSDEELFRNLVNSGVAVICDAGGIDLVARMKLPIPSHWILTPHAGELSRLINQSAKVIEENRFQFLKIAQEKIHGIILLKGFRTLISNGNKTFLIGSGNVALAKAGSGDVLSGFIGSLVAQTKTTESSELLKQAALAAFLHGRIADLWVKSGNSNRSLMASDLPFLLHEVMFDLKQG